MDESFYRAFEDRYRGSRELISRRLEAYLPFLSPLKTLYRDYPVLDLGCGRGEWLELLGRNGYAPTGVDLDAGMLEACNARGLPARKDDALSALRKLPDDSLVAVTGFHIAEHIPFPVLQELVAEALRVLRPAGLLILETPNAESLVVGTNSFYLDPTHERPLPNLLLSFLTEHSGFVRSSIVRLQEAPELHDESTKLGVWEVLSGTSPDYAVVAQKQAQPELLADFNLVFETPYGVSLDQLAVRYDRALEGRISGIEEEMATDRAEYLTKDTFREAMDSIHNLQAEQLQLIQERYNAELQIANSQSDARQAQSDMFQAKANALQAELDESLGNAHSWYLRANAYEQQLNASLGNAHSWYLRATAYEQQLHAVHCSSSWRVTAPLRLIVRAMRWPFRSTRTPLRRVLGRSAVHVHGWLARKPGLQRPVMSVLNRSPRLVAKLRTLYKSSLPPEPAPVASDPQHGVIDHAPLTSRGRTIESALQKAMTKGRK